MSTQKIPNSQKQIIQSNDGDYKGNVYNTFNIDLDSNPGVFKTSKKLDKILDTAVPNWADDDIVQAIQIHDGFYYVTTDDNVFRCSVDDDPRVAGNWGDITLLDIEALGSETDTTSFLGELLISTHTDVMSFDGSNVDDNWWTTTTSGTALTAAYPHILEVLRTGADTVFVTDKNNIRYYNPAAGHATITLDTLMNARCLAPSLDRMWAGTYTEVEDSAFVYEIAVGNDQANQAYAVDGRVCLSMFTYRNTPFVITEKGYVQAFNGAGFETVAMFPWANESSIMEGCRPGNVPDSMHLTAIHPKGVKVKGKYAYINVNTKNEYSTTDNLSTRGGSGVWVLDLETYSLTHRYSLTNSTSTYGTQKVDKSAPLLITNTPETRVMVGGSVDGVEGVWMEGSATPQGYFTTVRHEADSVADAFETFVVKRDTLDTGESIVVKYKDDTRPGLPVLANDVSWLNASQFTTTNALTNVEEDDEVEIIAGSYAGQYCTITNIEGDTTKTVTVDTDFGVLNALSDVQIDSWKAIEPDDSSGGEYKRYGASDNISPSRQYKVWMKGDVTVREVISKSNSKEQL
jgi:hypothetical protein